MISTIRRTKNQSNQREIVFDLEDDIEDFYSSTDEDAPVEVVDEIEFTPPLPLPLPPPPPPSKKRKKRKTDDNDDDVVDENDMSEFEIQKALFEYIKQRYPDVIMTSSMMGLHIPSPITRGKAQAIGAYVRGMPDVYLWDNRGGYGMMVIELKAKKKKVKKGSEQESMLKYLSRRNICVRVYNTISAAKTGVDQYMDLPKNKGM